MSAAAHLVVVDLQAVFEPGGGWPVPRFHEAAEQAAALVDAFGADVTFTRFVPPASPEGAWVDYYAEFPWALDGADDPMWDLTGRFAGRATLDAPTFGKWGPALAARAPDTVVVCGVSTDCCVLSTVLPAADAGRPVLVPADACAGATDEDHERALDVLRLYAPLVEITTTADILAQR